MNNLQMFEIPPTWAKALKDELEKPYLITLASFVEGERTLTTPIYPPSSLMFNALIKTPYDKVKVVIVGQDPYHGTSQAHGLSFSVPKGIPLPPSLQNIFKELQADLNIPISQHGCLTSWAEQGVLLLNATLTVRQSEPMSHHGKGWESFTDAIIRTVANKKDPVIFVLWGKSAQEKGNFLKNYPQHLVLTAPHPSPFSAHQGFFGCKHFSKINEQLLKWGKEPINWKISDS